MYKEIAEGVAEKANQEWLQKGIAEGIEKGIEKGSVVIARRLLTKGIPVNFVCEVTGLPEKTVRMNLKELDEQENGEAEGTSTNRRN